MNIKTLKNCASVFGLAVCCCSMTACTSLQSQMSSYDGEIRTNMEEGRWNAADHLAESAKFDCKPEEQSDVDTWRAHEKIQVKTTFAKSLMEKVAEANSFYSKGNLTEGDKVRQAIKDRYIGGQGGVESESALPKWLSGNKGGETGIPESLVPCLQLAWVNMLSDRNIARMSMAYEGYLKRIKEIDVNGGKKSIKEFDAVADGFKKVDKWKDKIDLFMNMLKDEDTQRWAPIDRSTYARSIKKMEALRDQVINTYKVKRWNTRVLDRKQDYVEIEKLTAAKNYNAAMQILSSHDWIVKPTGLEGVMDFDDQAERAKVASGALGESIVKQVFESGLAGVQYHRRTARRNMLSMLIVGRTLVEDKNNRRKLREAGRVAQMQARAEFVRYMNTSIEASTEANLALDDDKSHEDFKAITKERAQAEVSNLVVLATGVDGDDVVIVLGWRDPDLGMITPAPMHRVEGPQNFTVSPSVGAYL